ncbi:MAG: TonB-dependent receptor plug domain-containing protein [Flavobacteriales bacterium]|nr:TonB-dependent receptor plug domain-containing protein [Flavobacteriales bacterium]
MRTSCILRSTRLPGFPTATLLFSLLLPSALIAQSDTSLVAPPPPRVDTVASTQPTTPVISVTADDLDSEVGSQDISGILQGSRDVFTSTAGFSFGSARFRIRGYDTRNMLVSINGILVNDMESGWATWSMWAGLNDITRWMQVRTGVSASRLNFGGLGGYTDIHMRASEMRKGVRTSYASTNRAYRNRVMFTYNTGLRKDGWAFTISGSRRWAEEGYAEGTSFNAYAYLVSAEKRLNDRHSFVFTGFGAPMIQGRQGLAIQEAYDLAGTNYYNPNWGYQGGVKRNARMSFDHKPMVMASHYFTPDEKSTWNTTLFYTFGRDGLSGLNWFDARDPRPDYYRYLPSYFMPSLSGNGQNDPDQAAELANAWMNDVNTRQIDWDQLYFANGKNLYTVENANGIAGNTITGNRSKYILEEVRADPTRIGINSVYSKALENDRQITYGGSLHLQRTHYFKTIDDLLGGDFWVDIDQFADRDFNDTLVSQNDLDMTNKVVRQGDKFGYDYDIHTRYYNAFTQYEGKTEHWEYYMGAELSYNQFWREGRLRNGRFPNESLGDSEKQQFISYGVKGGAVYKLSGRQFLSANAALMTRPPLPRTAFISPRTRGTVVNDLQNETMYSGDLNYILRFPRLKGRATVYYSKIMDQIWSRSFYHDEFLTLVNYSMTGVDQEHMGVELGMEANLSSTWTMTAVYAGGSHRYTSRPQATITRDNSPEVFAAGRTVYWENFYVGGMPQTAASLGLRYNAPKFWFIGANVNHFDNMYLDPNPDRRTTEAIGNFLDSDPQVAKLLDQTKLDANYTVDAFFGKSWMMQRKYRIALNVSVSNVLNNQDFRIGGFEQLRYDRTDANRFPPKFSYLFGRNYFAMVTFSF